MFKTKMRSLFRYVLCFIPVMAPIVLYKQHIHLCDLSTSNSKVILTKNHFLLTLLIIAISPFILFWTFGIMGNPFANTNIHLFLSLMIPAAMLSIVISGIFAARFTFLLSHIVKMLNDEQHENEKEKEPRRVEFHHWLDPLYVKPTDARTANEDLSGKQ